MSCQAQAVRFAGLAGRLSGGINRLSSQQAFYSGLAVGVSGTGLVSLLVAKRAALGAVLNRWRAGASSNGAARIQARPIPQLGRRSLKPADDKQVAQPIPALAARHQPIKLQAGPVRMQLGQEQSYTAADSYRLVRADGSETGLALTPYLVQQEPTGKVARTEQWGVTHLSSGALVSGPYKNVAEAQALAGQLTALDWTKSRLPASDSERAKRIIETYQQRGAE